MSMDSTHIALKLGNYNFPWFNWSEISYKLSKLKMYHTYEFFIFLVMKFKNEINLNIKKERRKEGLRIE